MGLKLKIWLGLEEGATESRYFCGREPLRSTAYGKDANSRASVSYAAVR